MRRASDGRMCPQLIASLDLVLENEREAVFSLKRCPEGSLQEHAAIVTAIEHGDLQAIQAALQTHFERVIEDVEAGPDE